MALVIIDRNIAALYKMVSALSSLDIIDKRTEYSIYAAIYYREVGWPAC